MAWATPDDVREFTENESVEGLSDSRLTYLISIVTMFIKRYTCYDFDDASAEVLAELKIITSALVEMYVLHQENVEMLVKDMQSERIGDYSYTRATVGYDPNAPTGDPWLDTILQYYRRCDETGKHTPPALYASGPTAKRDRDDDGIGGINELD